MSLGKMDCKIKKKIISSLSIFDSSSSWVGISRCKFDSSYLLMIFSKLYHELVCNVEHFSGETLYTDICMT